MAGENKPFRDWVRTLPCLMSSPDCGWGVEAHHAGSRAFGRRAHDETCIPLCGFHHRCFHDASGPFKSWKKAQRREWTAEQIENTQARWSRNDELELAI